MHAQFIIFRQNVETGVCQQPATTPSSMRNWKSDGKPSEICPGYALAILQEHHTVPAISRCNLQLDQFVGCILTAHASAPNSMAFQAFSLTVGSCKSTLTYFGKAGYCGQAPGFFKDDLVNRDVSYRKQCGQFVGPPPPQHYFHCRLV